MPHHAEPDARLPRGSPGGAVKDQVLTLRPAKKTKICNGLAGVVAAPTGGNLAAPEVIEFAQAWADAHPEGQGTHKTNALRFVRSLITYDLNGLR